MRPATLLKKRLWHRSFPVNFAKFLRTPLDDCFWIFSARSLILVFHDLGMAWIIWPFVNLGIFPVPQGLWTPNLVGWWFSWDTTHKVMWHFDIVVTWQIKNVISPFSKDLWTSNLANWWLRMRRPHPQSHMTLQYCGHVTNNTLYLHFHKAYEPKLSRVTS